MKSDLIFFFVGIIKEKQHKKLSKTAPKNLKNTRKESKII